MSSLSIWTAARGAGWANGRVAGHGASRTAKPSVKALEHSTCLLMFASQASSIGLEERELVLAGRRPAHAHAHPDPDVVRLAVHEVRHHAHTLVELDGH